MSNKVKSYVDFSFEFYKLCEKYGMNGFFNVSLDNVGYGHSHTVTKENDTLDHFDIKKRVFESLIPSLLSDYECSYYGESELHKIVMERSSQYRDFQKEVEKMDLPEYKDCPC